MKYTLTAVQYSFTKTERPSPDLNVLRLQAQRETELEYEHVVFEEAALHSGRDGGVIAVIKLKVAKKKSA